LPASVTRLAILSSAPNPTAGRLDVEYAVPSAGHVRLRLLDVKGRECAQLLDREVQSGRYYMTWTSEGGNRTPPGVYFLWLELDGARATRRVVIAR
jgi:hypothetical protein